MPIEQDKSCLANFFTKDVSENYDERNSRLAPIADSMHFLIRIILENLPQYARILCIGVGTGAEILSLAREYPEWTFVGVDPSDSMLEVCRNRLTNAGIMDRCELIHGYVQDAPQNDNFDAALSILVAHFVARKDRIEFYKAMQQRLKPQGYFISTELSYDLNSTHFPSMLENWGTVQKIMGATPQSIQSLPHMLRDVIHVLPPTEIEDLMRASGFDMPVRFFQAFMINGWYGKKS